MQKKSSRYNKNLKEFSRELRNDSTLGETLLWLKVLRASGTGYRFNRQYSMKLDENQSIIVDFICRKLKLIIEIDGYSHRFKVREDMIRDEKLKKLGYIVLRFEEQEVRHDIDNVVKDIENMIAMLEEKL